jgi:hypothetical protein
LRAIIDIRSSIENRINGASGIGPMPAPRTLAVEEEATLGLLLAYKLEAQVFVDDREERLDEGEVQTEDRRRVAAGGSDGSGPAITRLFPAKPFPWLPPSRRLPPAFLSGM